jgi:hypothetical protein
MTSDDMSPRAGGSLAPEDESNIAPTPNAGATVTNGVALLNAALKRNAGIRSVRTRLQLSSPDGTREMTIDTVKPDRVRVVAPDGEIIVVGQSYYYKPAGGAWQVSNSNNALATSTKALDFSGFLGEALSAPGVTVSGKIRGEEMIEGVQTTAYELTVSDSKETGILQVWIGKSDGYLHRLFLSGPGTTMRMWLSGINENFTIQAPKM